MTEETGRCGYSKCRAELPVPGMQGGRPRSFCRETRWEGGRTCAQLAKAEKEALGALGLDAGSNTFRLDAERLRDHLETIREPVDALMAALKTVAARLDEVEGAAIASVETAHAQVAEAERVRLAAEEAREQAEQRTRQANAAAERAAKERVEAVDRATAAARQALESTEALGAARQQTQDAIGAREYAVQQAEAASVVLATAEQQLRVGDRERLELAAALERMSLERDVAARAEQERLAELEALRTDLTTERRRTTEAAAQAEATRQTAQEAETVLRADLTRTESELTHLRQSTLQTEAELGRLRDVAAQASAEASAETARLRAELAEKPAPRLHPDDLHAMLTALTPTPLPHPTL